MQSAQMLILKVQAIIIELIDVLFSRAITNSSNSDIHVTLSFQNESD